MNTPSHVKDLSINLDDEDRKREQEYEQRFRDSIERVLKSYNDTAEHGLATIERTTGQWDRRLKAVALVGWMRPLILGLSISIGIHGAHWVAIQWTEAEVTILTSSKAALQQEIEAQKKTIERLNSKTLGVLLHEDEEGRFVVLPAGEIKDWNGRHIRGRPAYRLKDR